MKALRDPRCWRWPMAALFCVVFVYAICAIAVIREVVVPRLATSSGGHLEGDAQYYHQLASVQAARIATHGLSAFELRPQGQGPAGVASLLYLGWASPYSFAVLNAALHALSSVLMVLILRRWFSWRAALLGSLPLAISPYMMLWFSQLNKDSFALAGALCFSYGLLGLLQRRQPLSPKSAFGLLLPALAGVGLLWIVRPYVNQLLLPVSLLTLGVAIEGAGARGKRDLPAFLCCGAVLLLCLGLCGRGGASDQTLENFDHATPSSSVDATADTVQNRCKAAIESLRWQNAVMLPDFANRKLRAIAGQRCNLFELLQTQTNPTVLDSFFDKDVLPGGSLEMLVYLPRAALFGVFAPLPDRWTYALTQRPSVFYAITPLEAVLMYAGWIGVLFWLLRGGAPSVLVPFAMALPIMALYGAATPFIGALYRYRYPWWMLLTCIGLAALVELCRRSRVGAAPAVPAR